MRYLMIVVLTTQNIVACKNQAMFRLNHSSGLVNRWVIFNRTKIAKSVKDYGWCHYALTIGLAATKSDINARTLASLSSRFPTSNALFRRWATMWYFVIIFASNVTTSLGILNIFLWKLKRMLFHLKVIILAKKLTFCCQTAQSFQKAGRPGQNLLKPGDIV
jgi:hypothetical protein